MLSLPIYLDYQATTPLDPRVRDKMEPFWGKYFGNPHSVHHSYGWRASEALAFARAQVASIIGADDEEILFTSGATESCNLALRGVIGASAHRNEIVVLETEHTAVLETARAIAATGVTLHVISVNAAGIVNIDQLREAVSEHTAIVSVMLVNNEIGVIQPISEIAEIAHEHGALMHTDATQAIGRIKTDVDELGVDLLSFSSHKMYGPMGIGALYVRGSVHSHITPIITGGGQESGIRSGTVPLPLTVGFGEACAIAIEETQSDANRIQKLTSQLWSCLCEHFPEICLNGHEHRRVPGNLNVSFPGISSEELVARVQDVIAISTGSACSSGGTKPSHVMIALGQSPEEALRATRISLGRFTTREEIMFAASVLERHVSLKEHAV